MIRIAKKSRLTPAAIIEKASQYFGESGEGLEEMERGACCIRFAGAGGYVAVTVADEEGSREVEVESREFDYQAKRFLASV